MAHFVRLCYTVSVATPIQAKKGGLAYGKYTYYIRYFCCGWRSMSLRLQMAGQKSLKTVSLGYSSPHKEKNPRSVYRRSGDLLCIAYTKQFVH